MLEQSLQHYKEISTQLNLPLICHQFQEGNSVCLLIEVSLVTFRGF